MAAVGRLSHPNERLSWAESSRPRRDM